MLTLRKGDKVVNLLTKLEEVNLSETVCNYSAKGDDNVLVTIVNRLSIDDLIKLVKDPSHRCNSAGSVIYGKSQFENKELVVPAWSVEQELIRLNNKSYLRLSNIVEELKSIVDLDNVISASLSLTKYVENAETTDLSNVKILFIEFGILPINSIKGYSNECREV